MLTYQMPRYGYGSMTVANEAQLNVVSFGLSQLFSWAMGCGVHRFELTAMKSRIGVAIYMDPLVEPGIIRAANCSTMEQMNDWKLIPAIIPKMDLMNVEGNQSTCWDGQARCSTKEGQGMLIQTYDVRPELTVAEWAFAHSDHFTGFFWKGVKKIKVFHSMKLTQIFLNPELDRALVHRMMTCAEDYPQGTLVSSIK